MNRRIVAAVVGGVAAVASVGTAIALPSHPSVKSGAFKFVAVQTVSKQFKDGHIIGGDTDMQAGHVIGADSISCVPASKTTANCNVSASYNHGQIYGTFVLNFKDGSLAGDVTGGTRQYKDATGTIKGTSISDTKEKVSITYQTP